MHYFQHWNTLSFTGHDLLLLLACYAIGCCTAGYYWVRWRTGLDLRYLGSGNVGARNVARIAGPSGFAVTLLIDMIKGALAVKMALHFAASADMLVASVIAVIVGHNY